MGKWKIKQKETSFTDKMLLIQNLKTCFKWGVPLFKQGYYPYKTSFFYAVSLPFWKKKRSAKRSTRTWILWQIRT